MYFRKPADGFITSFMDPGRKHPVIGEIRAHQGIDISSSEDNRIFAAASGYVQATGYVAATAGNYVWIKHPNGMVTNYSHMSRIDVKKGQKVKQGQVIGMKGATGKLVTGVHLHFEISKGDWTNSYSNKLNPLLHFWDPVTEEVQKMLEALGYDVGVDGIYGEKTITAVALYQKRNGLEVDGKAGRGTYAKLKAEKPAQVAADKPKEKERLTVELEFTSGTLRNSVNTFLDSKLQQEMAVKYAVANGLDQAWIEKQKNAEAAGGDLVGLLIVSAIKMLKENY